MFNPDWLRKRSKEAEAGLEWQRKEKETKRLREEELNRLEQERLRQVHKERERLRKLVESTISAFVHTAIKSALGGAQSAELELGSEFLTTVFESALTEKLGDMGYECHISDSSKWWATTSRIISDLLNRVASTPDTQSYRGQLAEALEDQDEQRLLELSHDLHVDKSIVLRANDELFLRLNVIPHLESGDEGKVVCSLIGTWPPIDVLEARFSDLHQVPSWMVSRGGSWLLERMGHCYRRDADLGLRETVFCVTSLPITPERWGENTMSKFVYAGEPIGTSPFSDEVMAQLIRILGFKVLLEPLADARMLRVSW